MLALSASSSPVLPCLTGNVDWAGSWVKRMSSCFSATTDFRLVPSTYAAPTAADSTPASRLPDRSSWYIVSGEL